MYYKFKLSNMPKGQNNVTCLTEAENFAEAAYKVIELVGTNAEIEEIKLMKNIKPAINEKFEKDNKLYMIKIAEDIISDGNIKTVKYELPVFASNANQLQEIVNDYISQGLENMRLTTISETKWIYI